MAKRVEIEVEIGLDGSVSLDVNGVKGKGCTDLTKAFEEALGTVEKRELKPEYHQSEAVTVNRKVT